MRRRGAVATVSGLGVGDHVCWMYDDGREFVDAALAFLADGLAAGQRLMYVSGRSTEQMLVELARLDATERLLATGGLNLVSLPDVFDPTMPIVPEDQLLALAAETEQAVAEGYTGLRVAADVTDLVAQGGRRPAHAQSELLAGRYMGSGHPLAALCAYDRRVVAADAVADLLAVHPLVHGPAELTRLRLYFDGDRLVLAGIVDAFSSDQIARLLPTSRLCGSTITLDVRELEFIDARGLHTLASWGCALGARGGGLVIEGASPLVRRAWAVLGFDRLPDVRLGEVAG